MTSGGVARGADGGSVVRQLYRRSPLRRLVSVNWAHRGLSAQDVFIAGYPRSGTSWLRFMLVEMRHGNANWQRTNRLVPYVGRYRQVPALLPNGARLIKTHERYLSRYRRAVHVVRDPRDVCISYFHFMQRIGKIELRAEDDRAATLNRFVEAFLAGDVDAHGTWQQHLASWTDGAIAAGADVLTLRYEDLAVDPASSLRLVADWLGVQIDSDAAEYVVEQCSVQRMRLLEQQALAQRPPVFAGAARRTGVSLLWGGRVGAWREHLTDEQAARFAVFATGMTTMGYALTPA